MTIEEVDIVDGMGTDPERGVAVLMISDHLSWGPHHFGLLEYKLASYVRFIESGQLQQQLAQSIGKAVEINLRCQCRPTELGLAVLEAAKTALNRKGIDLIFGPLPEGYADDAA